jgi:hypothetical protein
MEKVSEVAKENIWKRKCKQLLVLIWFQSYGVSNSYLFALLS